jgi:hypothetical protein
MALMNDIERRFSGKPVVEERDRSGETMIHVYYPPPK